jgi:hypothetical protein
VRVLALALTLIATTSAANADDDTDIDEDGEFVPMPKRSVGLSFVGHGTRIGGYSEGGVGPSLELAIGHGRWQYFGEGGVASSSVAAANAEAMIGGRMAHAGLGVRWLARQFRPDGGGGVELLLLSRLGVQRFYLDDGTRLGRPELAVGFGIQGRLYKRPRIAFRLDARVLLTPGDRDARCHVCMNDSDASTGFSTGFGLAW